MKLTKEKLSQAMQAQLVALFCLIEDVTGKNPDERIKLRVFEVADSMPYARQYTVYRQVQKLIAAIRVMCRAGVSLLPVMDMIQMLLASEEEHLNRIINKGHFSVQAQKTREG